MCVGFVVLCHTVAVFVLMVSAGLICI